MTVSSIPPVHSFPVSAPVANKATPAIATKPAVPAPVTTDSDGDRDGSRSGGGISVKA
jgi:hypothetical protein